MNKYISKFLIHNVISLITCSVLTFTVINSEFVNTFSGIMLGIAMYGIAILINGFVVLFSAIDDRDNAQLHAKKGKTILNG